MFDKFAIELTTFRKMYRLGDKLKVNLRFESFVNSIRCQTDIQDFKDVTNKKSIFDKNTPVGEKSLLGTYQNAFDKNIPPQSDSVNTKMKSKKYAVSDSEYEEMKKHFGTTDNFNVAGYMLKDGTMLDFSGKHWGNTRSKTRQVEHYDINEVLEELSGKEAQYAMVQSGNIRLKPEVGGINLSQEPTDGQSSSLEKYIRHFDGEVVVDFDNDAGKTVRYQEGKAGPYDHEADKGLTYSGQHAAGSS